MKCNTSCPDLNLESYTRYFYYWCLIGSTSTSRIRVDIPLITPLLPLTRPLSKLIFRMKKTNAPTLRLRSSGGVPGTLTLLRYSTETTSGISSSSDMILSELSW
ncbi:unnamed protein product [Ectocarpus sp. 12 AP-2014]